MLKALDPLLNGALLQILADMGHGNEIVIVDANYTASADAKRLVRLDGVTATGERRLYGNIILVKGVVRPEE